MTRRTSARASQLELVDVLIGVGAQAQWLAKPQVVAMLDVLGAAGKQDALSHDAVDALREGRSREHLRALLVVAGKLPARDYQLACFDRWAERYVAALGENENRQLITAYLRWHQRPRLASFAGAGALDAVRVAHARQQLNAAVSYLGELGTAGKRLVELSQSDVDALFAERGTYAVSVRDFLLWAARSKRCPQLALPCYRSRRRSTMAEDRRLELVRWLLDDERVDLADRVAGLLVLSLAQPVARIARLKADAVGRCGGEVTLRLAKTPAPLPPPVGALVTMLAERSATSPRAGSSDWLFPGRLAGEPAEPKTLTTRLRRIGVTCTGRRAALAALAHDLPAPVLVDVLGYSRSFATQFLNELRVDWNGYAALKARERQAG